MQKETKKTKHAAQGFQAGERLVHFPCPIDRADPVLDGHANEIGKEH
jgi:hypothetical protein